MEYELINMVENLPFETERGYRYRSAHKILVDHKPFGLSFHFTFETCFLHWQLALLQ
jgi:hypothetical protein